MGKKWIGGKCPVEGLSLEGSGPPSTISDQENRTQSGSILMLCVTLESNWLTGHDYHSTKLKSFSIQR